MIWILNAWLIIISGNMGIRENKRESLFIYRIINIDSNNTIIWIKLIKSKSI